MESRSWFLRRVWVTSAVAVYKSLPSLQRSFFSTWRIFRSWELIREGAGGPHSSVSLLGCFWSFLLSCMKAVLPSEGRNLLTPGPAECSLTQQKDKGLCTPSLRLVKNPFPTCHTMVCSCDVQLETPAQYPKGDICVPWCCSGC